MSILDFTVMSVVILDDGYRLNYGGYDFLAIHALQRRGVIAKIMSQVGIGKESDVFACEDHSGQQLILKLARLGRTSFRAAKNKRDYLEGRKQASWLYLSRLATAREAAHLAALNSANFPAPKLIDANRHALLMTRLEAKTM